MKSFLEYLQKINVSSQLSGCQNESTKERESGIPTKSIPHPRAIEPRSFRDYRSLLWAALILSGSCWRGLPVLAASPSPGTQITNQATGSFVDDTDNSTQIMESNIVKVTVAEVAGITVTSSGNTGVPTANSTVKFDFTITNVGNDPTQFFIPSIATITNGTLNGNIQIIGYDPDGSGSAAYVDLTAAPNNPLDVATGAATGDSALLGVNGSFAPGGYVKVRVPVKVNSGLAQGSKIDVLLGNTGPNDNSPDTQNQVFSEDGIQDVYTVDNNGTNYGDNDGDPINGDAMFHRQEASAKQSLTAISNTSISGYVFEDRNYGGGAGRPLSSPGTSPRSGATVELYDSAGNFIAAATTDTTGQYTFNSNNVIAGINPGTYKIRVVNSTVTSSRPGYVAGLLPIQTFRTSASTGSVQSVVDRVGGEKPEEVDPPARSGNQTLTDLNNLPGNEVQSVSTVQVSSSNVTGVNFGFNFDTIVNTNDSGQGSLRQFIINSNALKNTGLDQIVNPTPVGTTAVDPPAGEETSIFMIPRGVATPGLRAGLTNQVAGTANNSGAAVITLLSPLDAVTDSNTTINGFTQTSNVGDTNAGKVGTAPTVGISNLSVPQVERSEIVIDARNLTNSTNADQYALTLNGNYAVLKGIAVYGTKGNSAVPAQSDSGAIRVGSSLGSNVSLAGAATIQQNLIGTYADGTDPGSSLQNQRYGSICFAPCQIQNNYIAFNGYGTVLYGAGASGSQILSNDYQYNGSNIAPLSNPGMGSSEGDTIAIWSAANATVQGNSIANTRAVGSNALDGGKGIEIVDSLNNPASNNTISNNTIRQASTAGIGLYNGASQNTILKNIIFNTTPTPASGATPYVGAGILLSASGASSGSSSITVPDRNTISQNSIYNNQGLGIDIDPRNWQLGDGVTANTGTTATTIPNRGQNYPAIASATLNNGTLTLRGYVGNPNVNNGLSTFANNKLEFFVGDSSPDNQNGAVLAGDGKQLRHGEGKTYIGTCNTDASGRFSTGCSWNVSSLNLTDTKNITATATDALGNTSEFSASVSNANILMVKRITAINGNSTQNPNQPTVKLNQFEDDPTTSSDNDPNWPANLLKGAIDAGKVKPNDEIEYTIYFLNAGNYDAKTLRICDRITGAQIYQPSSMSLTLGNSSSQILSDVSDPSDRAEFVKANTPLPANCNLDNLNNLDPKVSNRNGTVVTDVIGTTGTPSLPTIPGATAPGTPSDSYGFFRFKTTVNPLNTTTTNQ